MESVTLIQGIGPATAAALAAGSVVSVADLIRFPEQIIHQLVRTSCSLDQVREWREMAHFIEIEGMTGQWAEALVKGGINTFEELVGKPLEDLQAVFEQALERNLIPEVPSTSDLFRCVTDAAQVLHSCTSTGTVLTTSGQAIEGAVVTVGSVSGVTDANGRYRLVRIPAASGQTIRVEAEGFSTLFVDAWTVSYDYRAIENRQLSLAEGAADANLEELDEFDGATLPGLSSYRTQWREEEESGLREGDYFRIHKLYERAPKVKIVSLFRAYRAGELIVRYIKLPLDRFDGTPEKGEVYSFAKGQFHRRRNSISSVERYRATRRALARNPELREPSSPEQLNALLTEIARENVLSQVLAQLRGRGS